MHSLKHTQGLLTQHAKLQGAVTATGQGGRQRGGRQVGGHMLSVRGGELAQPAAKQPTPAVPGSLPPLQDL